MRFSLSILPFNEPGEAQPYRRTFELCQLAEDLGYDTVMVGHHHFLPGQISDPFTLLAGMAARTTRLRLATAIFLLPLHHPIQVAERIATLDQLSGGRVSLGVGIGWNPAEYAAFGGTLAERGDRLEESLRLLPRLWSDDDVAGDGRFWPFPPVTVVPRPVQAPHPPLWVAGNAWRAIDRAARLGDAWLCDPVQTIDSVATRRQLHLERCAEHGRGHDWVLRRYAWLGPSKQVMEDEFLPGFVNKQLAYWRVATEAPAERALFARIEAGEAVPPTEVAAGRFLGGTPDDVIEGVEGYRERTGCDHISVGFGGGLSGRPEAVHSEEAFQDMRTMIERFGREVIPAFASGAGR